MAMLADAHEQGCKQIDVFMLQEVLSDDTSCAVAHAFAIFVFTEWWASPYIPCHTGG